MGNQYSFKRSTVMPMQLVPAPKRNRGKKSKSKNASKQNSGKREFYNKNQNRSKRSKMQARGLHLEDKRKYRNRNPIMRHSYMLLKRNEEKVSDYHYFPFPLHSKGREYASHSYVASYHFANSLLNHLIRELGAKILTDLPTEYFVIRLWSLDHLQMFPDFVATVFDKLTDGVAVLESAKICLNQDDDFSSIDFCFTLKCDANVSKDGESALRSFLKEHDSTLFLEKIFKPSHLDELFRIGF